jgi:hypothetical protein
MKYVKPLVAAAVGDAFGAVTLSQQVQTFILEGSDP